MEIWSTQIWKIWKYSNMEVLKFGKYANDKSQKIRKCFNLQNAINVTTRYINLEDKKIHISIKDENYVNLSGMETDCFGQ